MRWGRRHRSACSPCSPGTSPPPTPTWMTSCGTWVSAPPPRWRRGLPALWSGIGGSMGSEQSVTGRVGVRLSNPMTWSVSPHTRIHLAGHRGLVGSTIRRALEARGHQNLLLRTHQELDLTDRQKVRSLYAAEKPQAVILAAAKVGGILANWEQPYEFIQENLAIEQTVIDEAFRAGVKHLLFLGSSCIYPREAPQPLKEEYLLTGPLEETNRPYALAKIAGIELCRSLNREYGTRYLSLMPTNLYGPGDNFDLRESHVLAALIRRFHEAKLGLSDEDGNSRQPQAPVTLWGTGTPRREFLYADDAGEGSRSPTG